MPTTASAKAVALVLFLLLAGCGSNDAPPAQTPNFSITPVAKFDEPWAMAFLPDGRLLVSEKRGKLQLYTLYGDTREISGVPAVAYAGQGGFGDLMLHPDFANNALLYFSYAEGGSAGTGAAVARARLDLAALQLQDLEVLWRQTPKVDSGGHYGHRIAFDAAGYLWISSGERQQFDPAQDMNSNLGKIVRLHDDGGIPADNPFAERGGVSAEIWSLGHRNPLGLAFDAQGRLWSVEMGPSGGDELNLIERGENYGYPLVSNGNHYNGRSIPDHSTAPQFKAPVVSWSPVISPSSLLLYSGSEFPEWQGSALVGGLSSQALVRITFDGSTADGTTAREVQRFAMGKRIRALAQDPDGALWVLEDERRLTGGRLLRLSKQK